MLGFLSREEMQAPLVDPGTTWTEWSVLDWNMMAINFYRSLGARPLTDWTTMRLDADSLAQLGANEAVSGA